MLALHQHMWRDHQWFAIARVEPGKNYQKLEEVAREQVYFVWWDMDVADENNSFDDKFAQ